MAKKLFGLFIVLCISITTATAQSTVTPGNKDTKHVQKIKKIIFRSGVGPSNDIEVQLHDKTKVNGYLSEVTEDRFVVTDHKIGAKTSIEYAQVDKVRLLLEEGDEPPNAVRPGRLARNLAIGFGIGFGTIALVCLVSNRCRE